MDEEYASSTFEGPPVPHKDFGILPVPERLRCSTTQPFDLGPWSRIAFATGCALTVANMYYCQPLLIQMSVDFQISYADASQIPSIYQAGYCIGLFFISPMGDLLRRRQLIMTLVFITTCLSVFLALSTDFLVFQTSALFLGVFNVVPQILIPFAADLASSEQRGAAVSVLQSGIMLGIILARVIAGAIAYFFHWRMVHLVSVGFQVIVLIGTYLFIPDQPCKNPDLSYFEIIHSMFQYLATEPQLIQAVFINVASVACWSSFWVTLTFLLGGSPFYYSTLSIGLFGLVGVIGVLAGPVLYGQITNRLGPWSSLVATTCCLLILQSVETTDAGINTAVIVIFCIGLNALRQFQTVALQTIVFGKVFPAGWYSMTSHLTYVITRISENARSRLNAVLTLSLSAGQAMGASVGPQVFLTNGWRAASAFSMTLYIWQLLVLFLRGPNCDRYTWFGYEGGVAYKRPQEEMQNSTAIPATQSSSASHVPIQVKWNARSVYGAVEERRSW